MLHALAGVTGSTGFRASLLVTAFGFGFRHGIDWDHIAALTDITGSQESHRTSMWFATLYALGHSLVVFVLGLAIIVASAHLPRSVDGVMERVVGATLILLGIYVFSALLRHGRNFRMRSRWMLLFNGVRRGMRWLRRAPRHDVLVVEHDHEHRVGEVHEHGEEAEGAHEHAGPAEGAHEHAGPAEGAHEHAGPAEGGFVPAGVRAPLPVRTRTHRHAHRHVATVPDDPFLDYGRVTSFVIGMIHGVGAETPTQVVIFATAAGVGGRTTGIVLLSVFLAGLLVANTAVALASTFGFAGASMNWPLYLAVSLLTASFSLVIGSLFLFGRSTMLPAMFGG